MKRQIYLTIIFLFALNNIFSQHTLYNKDKQITKDGIFKDNKFWEGRSYFYDNSGNLLLIQFYRNGKAVRDSIISKETRMELNGTYQGNDLYIVNPFADNTAEYCVTKVLVNGEVTADTINQSAFKIDLAVHHFKTGDTLKIVILHKSNCLPKVIAVPAGFKSTTEISSISISNGGLITWKTKNEHAPLPFIIEQFRWNKWIKYGEVNGVGIPTENEYSFQAIVHHGENQFRVKQLNEHYLSKTISRSFDTPEVKFEFHKRAKEIQFTGETMYEVYDSKGNVIKKGFGTKIDVCNLPKGKYYLNYDNSMAKFKL